MTEAVVLPCLWVAVVARLAWRFRPATGAGLRTIVPPARTAPRSPDGSAVRRVVPALGLVLVLALVAPVAAPFGGGGLWWWSVRRDRRRRDAPAVQTRRALPEAVDLLAMAIGAGAGVPAALALVAERLPGPVGAALRVACVDIAAGRRSADALEDAGARLGEGARPLVAVLVASERYGAPAGPGLERVATELRAERRRAAEAEARRVPVRLLFPLVCCVLPSFGLLTVAPLLAGALDALAT